MPCLIVHTNVSVPEDRRDALLAALSADVADFLGKPERYVMVLLHDALPALFGGDAAPLVYMELKSIGLPEARTTEFSARLAGLAGRQFDVPPERIYVEFAVAARHMWGFNGATF